MLNVPDQEVVEPLAYRPVIFVLVGGERAPQVNKSLRVHATL